MNRHTNAFKAGVFILVAVVLFVFSIYFLGSERDLFSSQKDFYTAFKDVKGLSEGAPIRLGGITIGRVTKISFSAQNVAQNGDGQIQVTLSIGEKYLDRIRLDTKVGLETQGLLGDKFISISIGKDPRLSPPESFIPVSQEGDIGELMSKATKFADNTLQISEDLKALTSQLNGDNSLKEGIKEATSLIKSVNQVAKEVQNGSGLLHAMVYDKDGSKTVRSFSELSDNLSKASQEINQIVVDIRTGNGLIHDLVYNKNHDEKGLNDVIQKLSDTAENLKQSSEALKNGSGTLGALLVDSKLYDNLVEVTDGAKRSFILKQAIRSSMNNSEK